MKSVIFPGAYQDILFTDNIGSLGYSWSKDWLLQRDKWVTPTFLSACLDYILYNRVCRNITVRYDVSCWSIWFRKICALWNSTCVQGNIKEISMTLCRTWGKTAVFPVFERKFTNVPIFFNGISHMSPFMSKTLTEHWMLITGLHLETLDSELNFPWHSISMNFDLWRMQLDRTNLHRKCNLQEMVVKLIQY